MIEQSLETQPRSETATAASPEPSAIKRALVEIRELRARLAEHERMAREPIAIVGLSIRAPGGVHDAESYAELLWSGRDAIGEIPADRWTLDDWYDANADAPGKMTTRFGGFISDVDRFDAEFFSIAPAEAASMDPQQRLALELAWQALENAGYAPGGLSETRTGVYLGIANGDYGRALFSRPELIDAYFSPGNAFSVASGRIAYFLGLRGPAVSIDTACSSSLVALHTACQGLRHGDCDIALAGGVNLILTPEMNVNFSKAGMMAKDGRCKTFDASADGYVRGEGGGMVVLRRLSDARANGDRILALIRGTAVNQDGKTNGLTAPSGPSQESVIRAALEFAQVRPADIGYVEAHGTGTSLGDPIEVNAIAAVLGKDRAATDPVVIGSVKTNIGHLEAAAGIAGVIKTVLALQRREIPRHLNFSTPNPYIDWNAAPIEVAGQQRTWKPIGGRRLAGVSSFGFSGTNGHVILEEAPAEASDRDLAPKTGMPELLALSARDPDALIELARAYREILSRDDADARLSDICFTANSGRAHFSQRAIVHGRNALELAEAIDALIEHRDHPRLARGVAARDAAPRVAFLFPGQGPQYVDMGRTLYESAPAFRKAFDACAAALDAHLSAPLLSVVFSGPEHRSVLDETAFAQPAMFAIECSLAALWRSFGIEPLAAMGHSFGEYAAAHIAGAISLDDAARMVAARGRLVQPLPRDGAMIVLEASEAEVLAAIEKESARASIAAINGDRNTVISGAREDVERIAAGFASRGSRIKRLRVSHAFHSPMIEPILPELERAVSGTVYSPPAITLISNLSGRVADVELIGRPGYWRDHMRMPVRFADSARALAREGVTHYIEMSPQPVLLSMVSDCVEGGSFLPSLREGQDDWATMFSSLQTLYCAGASIDWPALYRDQPRKRMALPTYPFRRKRHWVETARKSGEGAETEQRWTRLVGAMDRASERGPLNLNAASYPDKWAFLTRLTHACAAQAFRDWGLFVRDGDVRSVDDVLASAGIATTYRHLIHRWLESLADEGLLAAEENAFRAVRALPPQDLQSLWREADVLFADNPQLLAYVRHCASLLTAVLTGRESPLETLFPNGSFELARGLYEQSSTMRYINGLAAAALESIAAGVARDRQLRIMEVGAGTGGTTSALLPTLSPDRIRYRFTDVSDAFLGQARARFASFVSMEWSLFDLEREPAEQGYAPRAFDVLVSANCVHAATDLRAALRRLLWLLAPGGVLVLVESTVHLAYFDMTTGLIEGWQHFTDDLRTDNPLLPPHTWIAALKDAGFADARAWPGDTSEGAALGQHVIIARTPGSGAAGAATVAEAPASTVTAQLEESANERESDDADKWIQRLRSASADEQSEILIELVRAELVRVLRLEASSVPGRHDRLMDLGMDSLMAVQLRNGLNRSLQLKKSLSSTLMFDYPTVSAIAGRLKVLLDEAGTDVVPSALPSAAAGAAASTPGRAAPAPQLSGLRQEDVAAMSEAEIEALLLKKLGSS